MYKLDPACNKHGCNEQWIITARKRSLGKVMFPGVSVHGRGGAVVYPGHWISHMVGYPAPPTWDLDTLPLATDIWWSSLETCLLEDLPPVLTPSGDHHNKSGWQAGGTHPTGMRSCFTGVNDTWEIRANNVPFPFPRVTCFGHRMEPVLSSHLRRKGLSDRWFL